MRKNEIHGKDMHNKRNIKEYNFDSFQTILDKHLRHFQLLDKMS